MTINEQIIHLIKTAGPITSADLFDQADLVENRKQLGNSLNRLRTKGLIERGDDGWFSVEGAPAESPEEPDADDPLAETEPAANQSRPTLVSVPVKQAAADQPEPVRESESKQAPAWAPVRAELTRMGYGPRKQADPWRDIHTKTQTVLDQLLRDDNIDGLLTCVIEIRDMALDNILGKED